MQSANDAISEFVLETFRLNGRLLAAGDALVAELDLTSARWQVLGAIALSAVPLPVAHIARNMGLTRQAVQRLANEMERDGLVRFGSNPHHQRAKLVLLTPRGRAAYDAAMKRQGPWARGLASGLSLKQIKATTETLRVIRERLGDHPEQENGDD
ncbi:MAG: MarR family transcriptional regulator [Pseudorhodoplanes sp.]|nr:MarR family transcriptional regulator [Pseudorhodoplanes sp.]